MFRSARCLASIRVGSLEQWRVHMWKEAAKWVAYHWAVMGMFPTVTHPDGKVFYRNSADQWMPL